MPLDPHARRFLEMLAMAGRVDPARATVEARRQAFRKLMGFSGAPPAIGRVDRRNIPGPGGAVAVHVYSPATKMGLIPGMVFFHGGGLVAGSLDTHETLCRTLANGIGCRVIAVDYRLAPEHKFPDGLRDGEAALRWAFEQADELGIDRQRLGTAGDSAGAVIAAALCQPARESEGCPPIAFQLLLCPITDFLADTPSRQAFNTRVLDQATMARDLAWYLPAGDDPADPRVSPLRAASFRGLPPAFIHTAECDPLRDEGRAYADRLAADGVAVRYTSHPGMVHLFYALGGVIPQARVALELIIAETKAALAG
jgi:acetyl esterase